MPTTISSAQLTVPAHLFPHTEVSIHDNTIRTYTRASNDNCRILAVFMSPKGRDRVMTTIANGLDEFDNTFGVGPYSIYGQPLLNARAALSTENVTLQCLRISAPDSSFANNVVWVQYKATQGKAAVNVGDVLEPATYYSEDVYNTEPILYTEDVYNTEPILYTEDVYNTEPIYYEQGEVDIDDPNITHNAGDLKYSAGDVIVHHEGDVQHAASTYIIHRANDSSDPEYAAGEKLLHAEGDLKTAAVVATEADVKAATSAKLQVKFVTGPFVNVTKNTDFDATFDLICARPDSTANGEVGITIPECEDGWEQLPFIGFASNGRGSYGNNYSFRISNHPRSDKTTNYKNYYVRVFEGTQTVDASTRVTLVEDTIVNDSSIYLEDVINGLNNGVTGSKNVHCRVNPDVLHVLYALYTADGMYPDTTITENSFDPILGIDKTLAYSKSADYEAYDDVVRSGSGIAGFEIVADEGTVQFNTELGIRLEGGDDGAFALSSDPDKIEARRKAIRVAYYKALVGDKESGYDPEIMSTTKFPLDAVFDADFPLGVPLEQGEVRDIGSDDEIAKRSLKGALGTLVETRNEDCFCFLDLGTDRYGMLDEKPGTESGFVEKEAAYEYAEELNDIACWWNFSIDAYYGKIRDPYNRKVITVTSTYNLIINYPLHWKHYDGKHIPYAGSKYGMIDQFIYKTIFPVFDVDLDYTILDRLADKRVNYAQINSKDEIIRGTQSTRWPDPKKYDALTVSNLSEINNALIILDIKKDAIKLVENYAYNFNESSDIALFNRDAEQLVSKYKDAQVRSITASFTRTEEEAELGILHLHIAVVHRALVKINLIDIDVNRAVAE